MKYSNCPLIHLASLSFSTCHEALSFPELRIAFTFSASGDLFIIVLSALGSFFEMALLSVSLVVPSLSVEPCLLLVLQDTNKINNPFRNIIFWFMLH
jgi:hypothetical protein